MGFTDFPDPASFVPPAVALRQGAGTVEVTVVADLVDRKVVLRPTGELAPQTEYVAEINSRVASLAGLPLGRIHQVRFTTGSTPGGGPAPPPPRSMADVQQIFDGYVACADPASGCGCARASCHGPQSPAVALILAGELSHYNLVNVTTTEATGTSDQDKMVRVKPGDPARSYLLRKLLGTPDIRGSRMPVDGKLDQDQLRRVRDWIAQGAPN